MAESTAHKFGQMVGNLLEDIMTPILETFCEERGLYLDKRGDRGDARVGKKVSWEDKYGNVHDLDFVIERGGSQREKGRPVAFIEAAWRRYTKHSRNKAQEIQGAVLPIAEKFQWDRPFLGAVLAGVFTDGSLTQMRSVGFQVLYVPYDTIVESFATVGVDVRFDETTPDEAFRQCLAQTDYMPSAQWDVLKSHLRTLNDGRIRSFFDSLQAVLDRVIERIVIVPLYGNESEFVDPDLAINFVETYNETPGDGEFRKYEVLVRFSNGDSIEASFKEKAKVVGFLRYVAT
ncbi:MAG: DNA methylase [Gammaproteobacteria bacterium]